MRRVTAVRLAKGEAAKKTAISGPEFFGYSLPHVRIMIESLPGANACAEKGYACIEPKLVSSRLHSLG